MSPEEVKGLVSYIGVLLQLVGSVLLVGLFHLLQRYARRRVYFTVWLWAWSALALAIAAMAVRYGLLSGGFDAATLGEMSLAVRAQYFAYQWAKLAFCGFLLAGTLLYASGLRFKLRRVSVVILVGSAAYALVSVAASTSLERILVWQAPLVIGTFVYCSVRLLKLLPSRSGFASKRTGILFGVIGALWVLYLWGFSFAGEPASALVRESLALLLTYNSYVDLLLQMMLGYGMVVMLMEDSRREVDDARARLEVAHDQLKREAYYDVLTGALNRRAFADGVGLEMAKATFGSVVVLDLDNFKAVNDLRGHQVGDALLRHLARTLRRRLRVTDGLYRWGGDEFLLVLGGARPAEAQRAVETTLEQAADLPLDDVPAGVRMSVSAGSAGYAGGERLEEAIARADAEMYRRKSGRKLALRQQAPAGSPPPFEPVANPPALAHSRQIPGAKDPEGQHQARA
jgi:diguanylate cyclase (GGDEF)-like protein